jgi:hypothetical protein
MQRSSGFATHPQGAARRIRQVNRRNDGAPLPLFGITDFEDVPGLGFDFPHLAAVSGNRRHHRGQFGVFPFGFNGFLLGSPPVIVEEVPAETQATPAEEENVAENETELDHLRRPVSGRRSVSPRAYDAQDSGNGAASTPGGDPAEYVFVRRDGGLVFAVAYSWENGTLRYVTREGMRRTIDRDTLDLTATQQFNEQRGLNFRSPA